MYTIDRDPLYSTYMKLKQYGTSTHTRFIAILKAEHELLLYEMVTMWNNHCIVLDFMYMYIYLLTWTDFLDQ